MKITEMSIRNPVGTILIILSVVVLGLFSIPNIPVSFWPEFVAPSLIVMSPYPGIGPAEIEEQIAKPLEEELSTIDGVDEIETTCMEGVCQMIVRFKWGVNFEDAKLSVQDRTNKARSRFPREALEPRVLQVQDFIPPGIELGFYSDQRDLNQVRDYVDKKVKNRLLRLEDVATVQISGGVEQHVAVWIDPDKLAAHGITLQQVSAVLASENQDVSAGKLTSFFRNHFIRTIGKYQELSDIENTIVSNINGAPVHIKDIGRVSFENKERETITRLNGKEIVIASIREKSGGNTVAMAGEVKDELDDIRSTLPRDIQVNIVRDQSVFIKNSINNVLRNAAIGAVLASIIILLFLGNLRNTLIIVLSIPISIIGTFVLVDKFGMSINTISLGGLALGVGMIVDSSIVVLENIYRHLRENSSGDRLKTVVDATREVGMAITSSNLTSIVVFLPLAFLVGLFAVLLGELALTVVFALSLSVIVALTVVPLLSYKLMHTEPGSGGLSKLAAGWQRIFDRILDTYRPALRWALRHRLLTLLFAGIILVAAVRFIAPLLDVELLPAINEGEFRIELTLPEGTQLDVTDRMTKEIENALARRQDVAQYYTLVGVFSARGELKPNFSTITIQLKPEYYQSLPQIMQQMREQWKNFPGTKVVVRQTDVTEGMRREPVNVRIVGDDLNTLSEIGQRVLRKVAQVPGIVNLNSSVQEGLSEFGIHVNRVKAADLGLSTGQISNAVRLAVLGSSITRFSTYGEEYDITVRADENKVKTINDLLNVPVANINGKVIPLEALATVSLDRAPSEIKRIDQQRIVEIKADVAGRNQRQVIADVRKAAAGIKLPSGYFITYGGQSKAIADSFKSLLAAMAIAIFLVYVVMGAQFNSFLHPFTIAFTIPLALIGVFLGLLVFGANLSMNALLGMIMLVGIVVNNGILLIDYINQLRGRGIEKNEAIVQAGATRLRPILITSLTTIFGMLPIALGLGEGGEALQPLGAVVVGGLATSTFLTLLVIPCVYSLVDRFSRTKTGREGI